MIVFLEGTLVEKDPTRVVLDVGGVGYEVFIPLSTYDRLPLPGAACRLLTYDHVREDIHALYGFASEAERELFATLDLGAALTARDLKAAILQADVKRLSSISGIGRKTAERMVLELKDKFDAGDALEAAAGGPESEPADSRLRDALMALISLGYKQAEAQKMVQGVVKRLKPSSTVEDVVRMALVR